MAALVGTQSLDDAHLRKVHQLKDFLEKSLVLDPSKHTTINQALIQEVISTVIGQTLNLNDTQLHYYIHNTGRELMAKKNGSMNVPKSGSTNIP